MRSLIAAAVGLIFTVLIASLWSLTNDAEAVEASEPTSIVRFVGSQYYPPLEWQDANNPPQGFIIELQRAMAASDGSRTVFKLMPWEQALASVISGKADAVALIPSDERASEFSFTQPFHYVAHAIFSNQHGQHYSQLSQLRGRTVAVVDQAYAHSRVAAIDSGVTLLITEDELDCLQQVATEKADACIEVIVSSNQLVDMYDLPVKQSSAPFWPQPYAFGVKKGNSELIAKLNNQLAQIVINGDYERIYKEWAHKLESRPHSFTDIVGHALWFIVPLLLLALTALAWSLTLRQKVARKTSALRQELEDNQTLREQIEFNSAHDNITGLLTRTAFFTELDTLLLSNDDHSPVTLICAQITNLESIITVFGYDMAFDAVTRMGERVAQQHELLNAHFGSGLFAIAADTPVDVARLIDRLTQPLYPTAGNIEPNLVFGVAKSRFSNDGNNAAELVRRAVTALTHAQKSKQKQSFYSPRVEPDVRNIQLLNDFQKVACEQFVLYYQPQLNLETGTITHAEALIRWPHPTLGNVPPDKFIPLLEESGGIKIVTRWVLKQAVSLLQHNELIPFMESIKISINISSRDLQDKDFLPFVRRAVKDINPSHLMLEITEGELIEKAAVAGEAIHTLASMGLGCAVDDFGTGYSSLAYLNELSVQEIKLDRLFVQGICHNKRSFKIVQSTIELAHAIGLSTVAEGVEDKETLELLRQMGCDRIQGYYIGKPMPETEFIHFVERFNE